MSQKARNNPKVIEKKKNMFNKNNGTQREVPWINFPEQTTKGIIRLGAKKKSAMANMASQIHQKQICSSGCMEHMRKKIAAPTPHAKLQHQHTALHIYSTNETKAFLINSTIKNEG
jgi:alanine racemase